MNKINIYTKAKLSILALTVIGVFIACSPNENGYRKDSNIDSTLLPKASFSASVTTIFVDESVSFTDTSEKKPAFWSWTFQGGTPTTSSEQNPVITYPAKGTFKVSLKVRNEFGISEEVVFEDYITVEGIPIPYLSDYPFNGNLDDIGLNASNAISNYGDPSYGEDRNGNTESSWEAPNVGGEYLAIPGFKGIEGNGSRTVMAWVKLPPTATGRNTITSWGVNSSTKMFNVMVQGGRVRVEAGASNVRSIEGNINDNTWHHVAVSYDPTDGEFLQDCKIYIDGLLATNGPDGAGNSYNSTTTKILTELAQDVRIGQAIYSANHRFTGLLDDLRVIDTALLPAEISAAASE